MPPSHPQSIADARASSAHSNHIYVFQPDLNPHPAPTDAHSSRPRSRARMPHNFPTCTTRIVVPQGAIVAKQPRAVAADLPHPWPDVMVKPLGHHPRTHSTFTFSSVRLPYASIALGRQDTRRPCSSRGPHGPRGMVRPRLFYHICRKSPPGFKPKFSAVGPVHDPPHLRQASSGGRVVS